MEDIAYNDGYAAQYGDNYGYGGYVYGEDLGTGDYNPYGTDYGYETGGYGYDGAYGEYDSTGAAYGTTQYACEEPSAPIVDENREEPAIPAEDVIRDPFSASAYDVVETGSSRHNPSSTFPPVSDELLESIRVQQKATESSSHSPSEAVTKPEQREEISEAEDHVEDMFGFEPNNEGEEEPNEGGEEPNREEDLLFGFGSPSENVADADPVEVEVEVEVETFAQATTEAPIDDMFGFNEVEEAEEEAVEAVEVEDDVIDVIVEVEEEAADVTVEEEAADVTVEEEAADVTVDEMFGFNEEPVEENVEVEVDAAVVVEVDAAETVDAAATVDEMFGFESAEEPAEDMFGFADVTQTLEDKTEHLVVDNAEDLFGFNEENVVTIDVISTPERSETESSVVDVQEEDAQMEELVVEVLTSPEASETEENSVPPLIIEAAIDASIDIDSMILAAIAPPPSLAEVEIGVEDSVLKQMPVIEEAAVAVDAIVEEAEAAEVTIEAAEEVEEAAKVEEEAAAADAAAAEVIEAAEVTIEAAAEEEEAAAADAIDAAADAADVTVDAAAAEEETTVPLLVLQSLAIEDTFLKLEEELQDTYLMPKLTEKLQILGEFDSTEHETRLTALKEEANRLFNENKTLAGRSTEGIRLHRNEFDSKSVSISFFEGLLNDSGYNDELSLTTNEELRLLALLEQSDPAAMDFLCGLSSEELQMMEQCEREFNMKLNALTRQRDELLFEDNEEALKTIEEEIWAFIDAEEEKRLRFKAAEDLRIKRLREEREEREERREKEEKRQEEEEKEEEKEEERVAVVEEDRETPEYATGEAEILREIAEKEQLERIRNEETTRIEAQKRLIEDLEAAAERAATEDRIRVAAELEEMERIKKELEEATRTANEMKRQKLLQQKAELEKEMEETARKHEEDANRRRLELEALQEDAAVKAARPPERSLSVKNYVRSADSELIRPRLSQLGETALGTPSLVTGREIGRAMSARDTKQPGADLSAALQKLRDEHARRLEQIEKQRAAYAAERAQIHAQKRAVETKKQRKRITFASDKIDPTVNSFLETPVRPGFESTVVSYVKLSSDPATCHPTRFVSRLISHTWCIEGRNKPYVVYMFVISNERGVYEVAKRFSELKEFDKSLRVTFPAVTLPKYPQSSGGKLSDEQIDKRKQLLERYMAQINKISVIRTSRLYNDFIRTKISHDILTYHR